MAITIAVATAVIKGRPAARDGRVTDAGKAICRHISLLAASAPRGTITTTTATAVEGGAAAEPKTEGGGTVAPAAAAAGTATESEGKDGEGEGELTMPELSRIGFEVGWWVGAGLMENGKRRAYVRLCGWVEGGGVGGWVGGGGECVRHVVLFDLGAAAVCVVCAFVVSVLSSHLFWAGIVSVFVSF